MSQKNDAMHEMISANSDGKGKYYTKELLLLTTTNFSIYWQLNSALEN
jgi:hypothetical protein